jgi:hypothetical protein
MPDPDRPHDMTGLTAGDLERTSRDLRASLALARPDSAVRGPILAYLSAIETEPTSHHWEARSEHISAGSSGDGAGTAAHSSRTWVPCFTASVRGLSGHWYAGVGPMSHAVSVC